MGGPGSGRWRKYQRRTQVEECLALDLLDLGRLGILSSPLAVAGQLDLKDGPSDILLGSANFWLGPIEDDNSRELVLRLTENLDDSGHPQIFKLDRVAIGCAPRWLLVCPLCSS